MQKVETAGDSYVAATGILSPDGEGFFKIADEGLDPVVSARKLMTFAKAMLSASKQVCGGGR